MLIKSEIVVDLLRPSVPPIVHAKQGDKNSRSVVVHLYENGKTWAVPTGAAFSTCYNKSDGKGGKISTNVTASGNNLTVSLVPQMLTCAGKVQCDVEIAESDDSSHISTFSFYIDVQESAESGITSKDYWSAVGDDYVDKTAEWETYGGSDEIDTWMRKLGDGKYKVVNQPNNYYIQNVTADGGAQHSEFCDYGDDYWARKQWVGTHLVANQYADGDLLGVQNNAPVTVPLTPEQDRHAASKKYVDNCFAIDKTSEWEAYSGAEDIETWMRGLGDGRFKVNDTTIIHLIENVTVNGMTHTDYRYLGDDAWMYKHWFGSMLLIHLDIDAGDEAVTCYRPITFSGDVAFTGNVSGI